MTLTLTPEQEALVKRKVSSGQYDSALQVIDLGLRLLDQQDKVLELGVDALRQEVEIGLAELRAGKGIPGEQVFAEIRKRSESRRAGKA